MNTKGWNMKRTIMLFAGAGALILSLGLAGMTGLSEVPLEESTALSVTEELAIRAGGEEIRSLRGRFTDSVKEPGGGVRTRIYRAPRYYRDQGDSSFRAPDLAVKQLPLIARLNPFRDCDRFIEAGEWEADWFDDAPYDYSIGHGGVSLRFHALFDMARISVETVPEPDGIKQNYVLESADRPEELRWQLETNGVLAQAEEGGDVTVSLGGEEKLRIPAPVAWDDSGSPVPVHSVLRGDTLIYRPILPESVRFPVTIDPSAQITPSGGSAGFVYYYDANYLVARNRSYGNGNSSNNICASQDIYNGVHYYVDRGFLSVDSSVLPANAVIDSAAISLPVASIYGSGKTISVVEGTFTGTIANAWYNKFVGWASGGVYDITPLAETINISSIAAGDTARFVLNETGLGKINRSGLTKFVFLSEDDISGTPPPLRDGAVFSRSESSLDIYYTLFENPGDFSMSAVDSTVITCSWTDYSAETEFRIVNCADSSLVATVPADSTSFTLGGLPQNTRFEWAAVAVTASGEHWSVSDSAYTGLDAPLPGQIEIRPAASDTLVISTMPPPNAAADSTGMEVEAVAGSGTSGSGWLDGLYSYRDGALDPDSTAVYRLRYRNGDGVPGPWSTDILYVFSGPEALVIPLSGDLSDDFNADFGAGFRDSTLVRAGTSAAGEKHDAFLSFAIPWQVFKGAVDSLFLTVDRLDESAASTPAFELYGITNPDMPPLETIDLAAQDSSSVSVSWTMDSGAGARRSPDLLPLYREWRELAERRDYPHGYGLRIDDSGLSTGTMAVFRDHSHPEYNGSTSITVYYRAGYADTLAAGPANLTLTSIAPDSILAAWEDRSFREYGFVLKNAADSSSVAGLEILDEDTISKLVGGLTPNTPYEWFVEAKTANDSMATNRAEARTPLRMPGAPLVEAVSDTMIRFILDPKDNPPSTKFALRDSLTGFYVDASAEPDTLRAGPPGDWGWRTYLEWGAALGDTLGGLAPDSLYVIQAKGAGDE